MRPRQLGTDLVPAGYPAEVNSREYEIPASSDAREIIYAVIDSKKSILLAIVLCIGLALIYLIFAERTYEVDALLKIQGEQSYLDSLLEEKQVTPNQLTSGIVKDEAQILKSRAVLGRVVDTLNLYIVNSPVYFPVIGKTLARHYSNRNALTPPFLKLGLEYAWGGEKLDIASFEVPEDLYGEEFFLVAEQSGYFSLYFEDERLVKSARIGKLLTVDLGRGTAISIFIRELRAYPGTRFNLARQSNAETINELRDTITVETEDVESKVLRLSLRGEDPDDLTRIVNELVSTYLRLNLAWDSAEAEQTLEFLDAQLPIVKAELEASEKALNLFRAQQHSVDFSEEAQGVLQRITAHETRLTEIQEERAAMRKKFKPKHDVIRALDSQISTIRGVITALTSRVDSLPQAEQELLRLTRNVEVNKQLYLTLLNSAQEQRVAKSSSVGSVRVIDDGMIPDKPIWPKAGVVLLLAGLLGLFFSLAAILIRKGFETTIGNPGIVEGTTGLPVFAAIPHSENQARISLFSTTARGMHMQSPVLAALAPHDITVESLRSLRTILLQNTLGARNNILMICSAHPGEGKSFISVNLGAVLAALGQRVLLVDTDLRRGTLHHALGTSCSPGLAEILTEQEKLHRVINKSPINNLHLIPKGNGVTSPSELLAHGKLREVLKALAGAYNYVIMDSPPILDVTDAAVAGQWAGLVLMVTKAGSVTAYDIQESLKRMQLSGVTVDGCIMNNMNQKRHPPAYGYLPLPNAVQQRSFRQNPLLTNDNARRTG